MEMKNYTKNYLSLIKRSTRRLNISSMNIKRPCKQFHMSLIKKILLSGATKNETTSSAHEMPAITNNRK